MALLNAVVQSRARVVGLEVVPDGIYREDHRRKSLVTAYPVQSGVNIADHAIREPDKLTLEAVFSAYVQQGQVYDEDAPRRAYAALGQLMEDRVLVTVHTLLGSYSNMLVKDLKATVDESTGRNLLATIEFQEVRELDEVSPGVGIAATSGPAANRSGTVQRGRQEPVSLDGGDIDTTALMRSLGLG